MKPTLIRLDGSMPPGGYRFSDPITGKQYNDTHSFFSERVRQICNDRAANHRMFTDEKLIDELHVAKELAEYTCERLRNDPKWCVVGDLNAPITVAYKAFSLKVCPHCGASDLEEVLCAVCGGRKVTGYTCKACHKHISL